MTITQGTVAEAVVVVMQVAGGVAVVAICAAIVVACHCAAQTMLKELRRK